MGDLVWKGRPSLLLSLPGIAATIALFFASTQLATYSFAAFFVAIALVVAGIAVAYRTTWQILFLLCMQYNVYRDHIVIKWGILNRKTDNLELYRIKDVSLDKPFWMRILGIGHIQLYTSDVDGGNLPLLALRDSDNLLSAMRELTESCRTNKGVREVDIGAVGGHV